VTGPASIRPVVSGSAAVHRGHTLLTLVRHGETDWNRERRIQGATDIPLNSTGIAQAAQTAAGLVGSGYAAVYSSPLSRALHTATIIADAVGAGMPRTHPDLRERSFGAAEGLTADEIAARFAAEVPGRETRESVVLRATPVLAEIAARHEGDAVLVVTHGAVISSLVRHLTHGRLPPRGEAIRNLSLSHFRHGDGVLRLESYNLDVVAPSTSSSTASSEAAEASQV
jgi:probable phosphoglycerate mutase